MVDWYNKEEIKTLKAKHDKKLKSILSKRLEAREKEDKAAMSSTSKALIKFMSKSRSYEKKAEEAGICWY